MPQNIPNIKYLPLSESDVAQLEEDRTFLPEVVLQRLPAFTLQRTSADLEVIQHVLRTGPYTDTPVEEVIAIGTTFGDLLADELGMHWIRYEDEEGADLAIRYRKSTIVVFPRTMILKRLERDEDPDARDLFEQVCIQIRSMLDSDNYQ